MMPVSASSIAKNPVHLLAFGFGSGLSPKAPGTVGTLFALLPYWLISDWPVASYLLFVAITLVLGIYLCGKTAQDIGVHDHGGIVWDEFVGFWIAMVMAPTGLLWVILGFVLFRLFDIVKPWPIGWLDKKVHGGLGIMLDDVVAGLFAFCVIQILARVLI